jgi:hypothetical protein
MNLSIITTKNMLLSKERKLLYPVYLNEDSLSSKIINLIKKN